jgi:hypothetical protein
MHIIKRDKKLESYIENIIKRLKSIGLPKTVNHFTIIIKDIYCGFAINKSIFYL